MHIGLLGNNQGFIRSEFQVGDRVLVTNSSGLWTEFASVPENKCFPIPDEMTFEEAAAIPVNYVTA